jgi:hypothetical protein
VRAARRIHDDLLHSAIDIGFRCAMEQRAEAVRPRAWLPLVLRSVTHRAAWTATPTRRPTARPPATATERRPPPTAVPPANPCAPIPGATYLPLPMRPPKTDRPAEQHADLNLRLRGYQTVSEALGFVRYGGVVDAGAPQLVDILKRVPRFVSTAQVFHWDWANARRGGLDNGVFDVTILGLQSTPMEHVHVPESAYWVHRGLGLMVMVLYASEERITLKYSGEDNVVQGYTLHIEDVCVEPGLLALYRGLDAAGRGELPAVGPHMPIGRARGGQVRVSIRDTGQFMDPRSELDWWSRKTSR